MFRPHQTHSVLGLKFIPECVELGTFGLAKQTRPGKEAGLQPIVVPFIRQDPDLCPVHAVFVLLVEATALSRPKRSRWAAAATDLI